MIVGSRVRTRLPTHFHFISSFRGGAAASGLVGQSKKFFEPQSGEKNFLRRPGGSGGMLPQKIFEN